MSDQRAIAPNEDPVCGMSVDPATARAHDLALVHDAREYLFCGKGCLLEFRDAPETYLAEGYTPSM
jgi:Cu+-exporting ATPase